MSKCRTSVESLFRQMILPKNTVVIVYVCVVCVCVVYDRVALLFPFLGLQRERRPPATLDIFDISTDGPPSAPRYRHTGTPRSYVGRDFFCSSHNPVQVCDGASIWKP